MTSMRSAAHATIRPGSHESGDGMRQLFVTSARMRLDDQALAREPLAGSVFSLDVGVAGLPEPRYRFGAST